MSGAIRLSTRERWLIAAAIALLILPARGAVPLIAKALGEPFDPGAAWFGVSYIAMVLLFTPLFADVVQCTASKPLWVRFGTHVALAVASAGIVQSVVMLTYFRTFPKADFDAETWLRAIDPNGQTGILLYATTAGLVRAIQWYRSSTALELERKSLESARWLRARRAVELTLRPGAVAETLARVAALLPTDRAAAERLVTRLARELRIALARPMADPTQASAQVRALRTVFAVRGSTVSIRSDLPSSHPSATSLGTLIDAVDDVVGDAELEAVNITVVREQESLVVQLELFGNDSGRVASALRSRGATARRAAGAMALEFRLPLDPPELDVKTETAPVVLTGSVYTWVVVYVSAVAIGAILTSRVLAHPLETTTSTVAALAWPVAALPLIWLSRRAAVLSRWVAVSLLAVAAPLSGAVVASLTVGVSILLDQPPLGKMPLSMATMIAFLLPYPLLRNVLIASAVTAVNFASAAGSSLLHQQAEMGRLRAELASAELREIESRMHPHFLLNALTSLLALVRRDQVRAIVMCSRLGDLFSRTVAAAGVEAWPLEEELELVLDYVSVQEIRFGSRMQVRIDVPAEARSLVIPRLLLQPLVENAVKHGVADREEPTGITITASADDGELNLEITNDATPLHAETRVAFGRGLRFVETLARSAGGTVIVRREAARFVVRVRVPSGCRH